MIKGICNFACNLLNRKWAMSQDVISKIMNKKIQLQKGWTKNEKGVYESTSGDDLGRVESCLSQVWACMLGKWQVAAMQATTKSNQRENLENGFGWLVNPSVGVSREFTSRGITCSSDFCQGESRPICFPCGS